MEPTIKELRMAVLARGQQTKDKRLWQDIFAAHEELHNKLFGFCSADLCLQISADMVRKYKFYDSLCMILGQVDKGIFVLGADKTMARAFAEAYLREPINI